MESNMYVLPLVNNDEYGEDGVVILHLTPQSAGALLEAVCVAQKAREMIQETGLVVQSIELNPVGDVWFFASVPPALSLDEAYFDYDPGEDYQQLTIPFDVEREAENAGDALHGRLIVAGEDIWFTAYHNYSENTYYTHAFPVNLIEQHVSLASRP